MLGNAKKYGQETGRRGFDKNASAAYVNVYCSFVDYYCAGCSGNERDSVRGGGSMNNMIRNFIREEDGLGTVEIVVIIAVLVGIALIFRDAIIKFVTGVMSRVFGDESIIDEVSSSNIRNQNKIN